MMTIEDHKDLLADPKPQFTDTALWERLFRSAVLLPDTKKGMMLLRHLWSLRCAGTLIVRNHHQTRFKPLIHPNGLWDSEEEFNEIKNRCLRPYADELVILLNRL